MGCGVGRERGWERVRREVGGEGRCCRSDVAAISPDCYLSVIARRSAAGPPAQGAL